MDIQAMLTEDVAKAEAELVARDRAMKDTIQEINDFAQKAEEIVTGLRKRAEERHKELLIQQGRVESVKAMLERVSANETANQA